MRRVAWLAWLAVLGCSAGEPGGVAGPDAYAPVDVPAATHDADGPVAPDVPARDLADASPDPDLPAPPDLPVDATGDLPPDAPADLPPPDPCASASDFEAGAGIYDVTGPVAELGMMGYAMLDQKTAGLHTRLRARAFVVGSPCNGRRVVFVSADLLAIFQGVRQQVVARLRERYGDLYRDADVFLSATHTHSGPGAYSHYTLYNLTTLGFSPQNFEAVVDGIVQAIVRAHEDVGPARLRIAEGDLLDASINRSPDAYAANPADERARYPHDTDKRMTVLRLDRPDGTGVGVIAWFGVHATSMGNENRLISGDNKGYASYRFERWKGTDPASPHTFVAAFAQATEGDASPNILGGEDGGGADDFESTAISGEKQYQRARELYEAAVEPVSGPVGARLVHVRMDAEKVDPAFADGQPRETCVAAIGTSMVAGAEDGPGFGKEGMSCEDLSQILTGLACKATTTECQAEKPIALETGNRKPHPWTPPIVPLQVLRIGSLALVGVPFETTTMAARRVRGTVLPILQPTGVTRLVLAGPVNAFAGYMTTREEYAKQNYEGASTHFGPWQLSAVRQNLAGLASAMVAGTEVLPGPTPPDLSAAQTLATPGVVYDDKPLSEEWGQVLSDVPPAAVRGETVSVTFRGAHPDNDLRTQGTYLQVERRDGAGWVVAARDWDWETRYRWSRDNCFPTFGCSKVTVEWDIPPDAEKGPYRIRTFGTRKGGLDGELQEFVGSSSEFRVE